MQFKTDNRPMIAVYQANAAYLRKTMDPDALHKFVSDQVGSHFKGSMLRVDARIEFEDAAPCSIADHRLTDIETLLVNMNIYTVVKIGMRLSDSCLDRWLECPKNGAYEIKVPTCSPFGRRWLARPQDEIAESTGRRTTGIGRDWAAGTHIYIPSTENKEIPIYPCEPFGVKKVNPKPAAAEPETNPATLNLKADTSETTVVIGSFGKAVTDLSREIQVSNLKAAARNPEVREALFKALRKDGDQETLTALFRLSREALFGIEWDEVNGKTRKPTK